VEFEEKEWRNGVGSACRSMRVCLDLPDVVLAVRPPGRRSESVGASTC